MKRPHSTWLLFISLYGSQYICISFIGTTIVALLREQGASLSQLGLINLVMLPLSLKFIWAPLVDRFGRIRNAHYRNWLLPTQLIMVSCLGLLGMIEPIHQLPLLWLVLTLFFIIVATQDLALDALATITFTHEERPKINGIQVGSGMLGNIVGGALMLLLFPRIGWQACLNLIALMALVPFIQLCFFKEIIRVPTIRLPHLAWSHLWKFWRNQGRWALILFLYAFGFAAFFLLTPTLVDNGWSLAAIGTAIKIYGSAIGLLSALLFSWLLHRWERKKSVVWLSIMQALCLTSLFPVLLGNTSSPIVYVAITVYFLGFSPMYAILSAVMMDKAAESSAPATIYTVQNAAAMLLAFLLTAFCAWLAEHTSSPVVLCLSIIALLSAGLLYQTSATQRQATRAD